MFDNSTFSMNDEFEVAFEEKRNISPPPEEPTLLDKALSYRVKNSKKWKVREKDREATYKESFGIYDEDSFLDSYYKQLDETTMEKKKFEEELKSKPPQLVVQIQHNIPGKHMISRGSSTDSCSSSTRRVSSESATTSESDANSECEIFKMSPTHDHNQSCEEKTEVLITLIKGKYLLNWLRTKKRKYKTCTVKCYIHVKSKQTCKKLKTRASYVNMEGTARYHHVFRVPGLSTEELSESYIILEVTGRNNGEKDKIGKVLIAGQKAQILDADLKRRGPTPCECSPWEEALNNPGIPIRSELIIRRMNEDKCSESTVTPLSRSDLGGNFSEKQKWNRRKAVTKHK